MQTVLVIIMPEILFMAEDDRKMEHSMLRVFYKHLLKQKSKTSIQSF